MSLCFLWWFVLQYFAKRPKMPHFLHFLFLVILQLLLVWFFMLHLPHCLCWLYIVLAELAYLRLCSNLSDLTLFSYENESNFDWAFVPATFCRSICLVLWSDCSISLPILCTFSNVRSGSCSNLFLNLLDIHLAITRSLIYLLW